MKKLSFVILLLLPLITFGQAVKRYRTIIIDNVEGLNGGIIDVKDTLKLDSLAVYATDLSSQYTSRSLVDSAFVGIAISTVGGNTIYTADDALAGNRTVTMGGNNLTFSGNLTTFKGINAASSNFVLSAEDNVGTKLFRVRNDGKVRINTSDFSQGEALVIQGLGTSGLILDLHRNSGGIGSGSQMVFSLNNVSAVKKNYATINGLIIDNTASSEDGGLLLATITAGAVTEKMRIETHVTVSSNLGVGLTNPTRRFISSDLGAFPITAHRQVSSLGNGVILSLSLNNTLNNVTDYAFIQGIIGSGAGDNVEGTKNGSIALSTATNGSLTEKLRIDNLGNMGLGTTSPAVSAKLEISTTTGAVLFPRMTTAQRDALTPVDGMVIYNTTLNKLQVRAAAAWVSLH